MPPLRHGLINNALPREPIPEGKFFEFSPLVAFEKFLFRCLLA
jgi:hypothetical protein